MQLDESWKRRDLFIREMERMWTTEPRYPKVVVIASQTYGLFPNIPIVASVVTKTEASNGTINELPE